MIKGGIFIFITLTLLSCGPRTGVHEEAVNTKPAGVPDTGQSSLTGTPEAKGHKIFKQNCAVFHFISTGQLTGPGLGGVMDRLPSPRETYFIRYIAHQDSLLKKDPYAKALRSKYQDVPYTHDFGHMSASDGEALILYLKAWDKPVP